MKQNSPPSAAANEDSNQHDDPKVEAVQQDQDQDKVRVEYIANAEEITGNVVQIVDFGNNFSTAIVATSGEQVIDERNGIITVISNSAEGAGQMQIQDQTTYEYIPLNTNESGVTNATAGVRDALQAALESAEVDKMELLRTADGTIIYENPDSNSHTGPQVQVSRSRHSSLQNVLILRTFL